MRRLGAFGLALLLSAAPARAAEPDALVLTPMLVRLEFFQLADASAQRLSEKGRLRETTELSGARSLQLCEMMILPNVEAQFFLGRKTPLFYYDPRASQFQVNYVDTGCKLDVRCRPAAANQFTVELRTEIAATEKMRLSGTPVSAAYPQNANFNTTTSISNMQLGETALIGRLRGQSAADFLQRSGTAPQGGDDNVITVITLERI